MSLGMAPVFTLTTDLVVGSAPPERAGAASALSETSAEMGGALGIALFGSLGIAVYRRMMAGVIPAGVPPEAAESARATLAGALTAARELPNQLGDGLKAAAQIAFLDGLRLCVSVSGLGSIALAIYVAVALRHRRAG